MTIVPDHPDLAPALCPALAGAVPRTSKRTLDAAGEILRALAAPVRIAIVLQLQAGPRCVHELVEALDVTQPLISQHLRVLKSAGVVRGERSGREVLYSLLDDHLAHIVRDAVAHAAETNTAHAAETNTAHAAETHVSDDAVRAARR